MAPLHRAAASSLRPSPSTSTPAPSPSTPGHPSIAAAPRVASPAPDSTARPSIDHSGAFIDAPSIPAPRHPAVAPVLGALNATSSDYLRPFSDYFEPGIDYHRGTPATAASTQGEATRYIAGSSGAQPHSSDYCRSAWGLHSWWSQRCSYAVGPCSSFPRKHFGSREAASRWLSFQHPRTSAVGL